MTPALILVGILVVWAAAAALGLSRQGHRRLTARLQRAATAHLLAEEPVAGPDGPVVRIAFPLVTLLLDRLRWRQRVEAHLRRTELSLAAGEYVACLLTLWVAAPTVAWGLGQPPLVVAGVLAVAVAAPVGYASLHQRIRRKKFGERLPDALDIISSALRVGHGLQRALHLVGQEAEEPLSGEFRRVMADIAMGCPVDVALERAAGRVGNPELDLLATVVGIQMEVGGNMAECFDRISETLRDREELANEVKSLTAEGKMTAYVCAVMPPAMGLLIAHVNPEYMAPMISTPVGHLMLAATAVMQTVGIIVVARMMKLEA